MVKLVSFQPENNWLLDVEADVNYTISVDPNRPGGSIPPPGSPGGPGSYTGKFKKTISIKDAVGLGGAAKLAAIENLFPLFDLNQMTELLPNIPNPFTTTTLKFLKI